MVAFCIAADLTCHFSIFDLQNNNALTNIVQCVYKNDSITIISEVYRDFAALLNKKRGIDESFQNFESRFAAQLSRLKVHGEDSRFADSMAAMALMNNASIHDARRI